MKTSLLQNSWIIVLMALFIACTSDKNKLPEETNEETGFILDTIFNDSLLPFGAKPGIAVTDLQMHHPLLLRTNLQVDSLYLRSGIYIKLFYHSNNQKIKAIDAFCYFDNRAVCEKEKAFLTRNISELYGAPLTSGQASMWLIYMDKIPPWELVLSSCRTANDQAVFEYSLYQRDTF